MSETHPIDRLYATIAARKGGDPDQSYTAKLLGKGVEACAKKFGEEAVETVLAAVSGEKNRAYRRVGGRALSSARPVGGMRHRARRGLCVLRAREGVSGLAEKASRKK